MAIEGSSDKPTRDDRLHISVDYKPSKKPHAPLSKLRIADWCGEEASSMLGAMKEKDPPFINSVLKYCEKKGILRK